MKDEEFENARLALFERLGAPVKSLRLADRQGRTIYALERGGGDPVIVLHGGGGEPGQWAPLLRRLQPDHRYILVDRPGHGLSYRIDYSGLDFEAEAARFVEDVVSALGAQQVTLIASSMGGFFAFAFALAHPERVRQLVLVGAPAGVDVWIPPFLRLMGRRGVNRLLFRLMRNPTPSVLRDKLWKPLLVVDPAKVSDEILEVGIAASALPGAELAWRTLLESFVGLGGVRKKLRVRERVCKLAVPTTFVWGDRDAFAPPASGEDLVSKMPNARLVTVANAGHLPWFDDAPACASAIAEALGCDARQAAG